MKQIKWENPNKMRFESHCETCNEQVSRISTGNQIGDTALSSYVRPYNETECNGREFPKGHLQEYDLGWLVKDAPREAKDWIRTHGRDTKFILYVFFHEENGGKIVHGAVITNANHDHVKTFYAEDTRESRSVIDEATKYVVN